MNAFSVSPVRIGSSGLVILDGLEVYSDPGLTQDLSSIDWGELSPGETVNRSIYVKNTGPGRILLGYSLQAWAPPGAEAFLIFSWDYQDTDIYPDDSQGILLSLEVLPEIQGITEFSFDIVVSVI